MQNKTTTSLAFLLLLGSASLTAMEADNGGNNEFTFTTTNKLPFLSALSNEVKITANKNYTNKITLEFENQPNYELNTFYINQNTNTTANTKTFTIDVAAGKIPEPMCLKLEYNKTNHVFNFFINNEQSTINTEKEQKERLLTFKMIQSYFKLAKTKRQELLALQSTKQSD